MINILNQYFFKDFDELYSGLLDRVKSGHIIHKLGSGVYKGLELFTYSRTTQMERAWDKFTILSRGLVLEPEHKRIIAVPFPKFFNYGEMSFEIPKGNFSVLEKLDGSLGIIFYWRGKYRVITKGSFNSDQAKWATKFLEQYRFDRLHNINFTLTIMVEIIYPDNRIVVDYKGREDLTLLGMHYISVNGDYVYPICIGNFDDGLPLEKISDRFGFGAAKEFESLKGKSIKHIQDVAKKLPVNEEGFVVVSETGYRIKLKGDEYLRIHKILSEFSPLAVWDTVRKCDPYWRLQSEIPEEFWNELKSLVEYFKGQYEYVLDKINRLIKDLENTSPKEIGLHLKGGEANLMEKDLVRYVFKYKKNNQLITENPGKIRDNIFELFRPKGNILVDIKERWKNG